MLLYRTEIIDPSPQNKSQLNVIMIAHLTAKNKIELKAVFLVYFHDFLKLIPFLAQNRYFVRSNIMYRALAIYHAIYLVCILTARFIANALYCCAVLFFSVFAPKGLHTQVLYATGHVQTFYRFFVETACIRKKSAYA